MRIQHNIMAMNAYRNYNNNTKALSGNLEKLSSGYKINRAGDDAAGLAISEKMRAQITGLDAAQKNVKDGTSLVKTAEGAMQEIQDMLNRMDYLATQSANGTYDNEVDRANLQKEVKALKEEINRIADSANFNGIKLLNGEMEAKKTQSAAATPAGTNAISTADTDITTTDGQNPTKATKAKIEFTTAAGTATLAAGDTGLSAGVVSGTTTASALGAMTVGGLTLKDNFKLQVDGADVQWTDATAIDGGKKITLTAKTPGALKGAVDTALNGKAAVTYTPGVNEGSGAPASRAEYTLKFSFANLAGGQKFEIGANKFEIVTGDATQVTSGYTAIDLSGLDLTVAGDDNAKGQWGAAKKIQEALSTKFGTNFQIDAVPDAAPAGGEYTIKMIAKNAETASASNNLGDVRVSETNETGDYTGKSGITGTYKPGQVEGPGKQGTYATVTYANFDISKLAVGDKISIYGKTVEVVDSAAEADPNKGKLVLDDARDGTKLTAAFERMFRDASQGTNNQQNFGKLEINASAKTLKVTDSQDVGRTGAALKANVALAFTPKTAASSGSAAAYDNTTGGLTLQIGDTSDTFNQMKVSIGDMHVTAMGTNYTVGSDGKRIDNTDVAGNVTVLAGKSINDIDISTQKGAQDAISVIKDAINYVSGVRGDLGAIQNRLDHTANNLSVMAENIQDAESTIRDTDVADEMMKYVKNNILVQSAQAMLAQANQVPQGVLQLLG